MQQQRVLLRSRAREVPRAVAGESLRLRGHPELLVEGDDHRVGCAPPGSDLVVADAGARPRAPDTAPLASAAARRLRAAIRFVNDVVVYERGVLVRAGDAVDAEAALGVVVTERAPEPCGLDEQLETRAALEVGVVRRGDVAANRVGDVGVDVERRRAGGPVSRALLAPDRPPRERRARQTQLAGARLRARPRMEWRQRSASARGLGRRVRQDAAARTCPCPRTCGRRSRGR